MNQDQVKELLLQSLQHERGGIQVYETALQCVQNDDLKEEWGKYLEQTRNHERILLRVFQELGLDAEEDFAKLAGAAGLLAVAVVPVGGLADRFAIGDLGWLGIDVQPAPGELFQDQAQVQFT